MILLPHLMQNHPEDIRKNSGWMLDLVAVFVLLCSPFTKTRDVAEAHFLVEGIHLGIKGVLAPTNTPCNPAKHSITIFGNYSPNVGF
jgi:hypothetical protein